jgi:hypothetical protein
VFGDFGRRRAVALECVLAGAVVDSDDAPVGREAAIGQHQKDGMDGGATGVWP